MQWLSLGKSITDAHFDLWRHRASMPLQKFLHSTIPRKTFPRHLNSRFFLYFHFHNALLESLYAFLQLTGFGGFQSRF